MAWVATTSFETTDGSTAPTDGGAVPGTGDGTGWSGNWTNSSASGYFKYDDDATAPAGTWAVMQDTSGVNAEPVNYRDLTTAVTSGRVSFKVKLNRDDRDDPAIALQDGANRKLYLLFGQQATGTNRDLVDNTGVITENCLVNNTWYTVDIDFDVSTDTYDVYLDGVKKNSSARNFENTTTQITRFRIANNAASGFSAVPGNILWVDDIKSGSSGTNVEVTPAVLALTSSLPTPTIEAVKNVTVTPDAFVLTSSLPTPSIYASQNTFPVIQASANTSVTTRQTSHSVNLPASIQAGELLMMYVTAAGTTDGDASVELATITTPSGWTQLFNTAQDGTWKTRHACYYKTATGSEGATVALTTTGARIYAVAHRISGHTGTPEAQTATGAGATPDAPSITPSWGQKDTLFIASLGNRPPHAITDSPDSYTDEVGGSTGSALSTLHCRTATLERNNPVVSEDPTSWTLDNNADWVTSTVAVEPAPVANVNVSPSVLALTTSIQEPAVGVSEEVLPDTLALTVSLPVPTIFAGGNINNSPDAVVATVSLPTPTVTAERNISVSADVVTATTSLPTPSVSGEISGGVTVTPDTQTLTASVLAPTISTEYSISVSVSPVSVTVSLPTPTKVGGLWTRRARVGNASDWTRRARVQ